MPSDLTRIFADGLFPPPKSKPTKTPQLTDQITEALARADGHRWTHATEARRDILRKHYSVAVQAVCDVIAITAQPATTPTDFYRPGFTYAHPRGWKFRCETVTFSPDDGALVALGWRGRQGDDEWIPYAYYQNDWNQLDPFGFGVVTIYPSVHEGEL